MIAIDTSGSMGGRGFSYRGMSFRSMGYPNCAGAEALPPVVGAGAMSMVVAKTEPQWSIYGFNTSLQALSISPRQRIDDVCKSIFDAMGGGTDCALPMIYAAGRHSGRRTYSGRCSVELPREPIPIDTFIVYTDNETWAGSIHPAQALQQYRQVSGIPAKLIVVGMTSTGFSIADPNDAGMLDVVGFDSSAPAIMADFARG
jgi:60 kDa SS-A/Ro ribonucleoprotein